jgi:hypothetical protein
LSADGFHFFFFSNALSLVRGIKVMGEENSDRILDIVNQRFKFFWDRSAIADHPHPRWRECWPLFATQVTSWTADLYEWVGRLDGDHFAPDRIPDLNDELLARYSVLYDKIESTCPAEQAEEIDILYNLIDEVFARFIDYINKKLDEYVSFTFVDTHLSEVGAERAASFSVLSSSSSISTTTSTTATIASEPRFYVTLSTENHPNSGETETTTRRRGTKKKSGRSHRGGQKKKKRERRVHAPARSDAGGSRLRIPLKRSRSPCKPPRLESVLVIPSAEAAKPPVF